MNKKMKDILVGIFAVALIAVCAIWFLSDDLEHIEDTNGPDNFALTVITDENIINRDMGALNPVTVKKSGISVGGLSIDSYVQLYSENFTGVYELFYQNLLGKSDFVLNLDHLTVDSGNFKMVVLLDEEIVATIEPSDEPIEFRLDDINGYVSVRIAGESASYSFAMPKYEYDLLEHQ